MISELTVRKQYYELGFMFGELRSFQYFVIDYPHPVVHRMNSEHDIDVSFPHV